MSKEEIAHSIPRVKSAYGNSIKIIKNPTEEFMWLLGIIVTDGNLNRIEDNRTDSSHTTIRVFNTDKDIIEKAKSAFNSLSLECYEEEREGKYRLEVGNTLLAKVMNQVFGIPYGNKSQETKIPEKIFQLPEKLQTSFIEGVLTEMALTMKIRPNTKDGFIFLLQVKNLPKTYKSYFPVLASSLGSTQK